MLLDQMDSKSAVMNLRNESRITVDLDSYRKLWENSGEVFITGRMTNLITLHEEPCCVVFDINSFQAALKHWYSIKNEDINRIILASQDLKDTGPLMTTKYHQPL